jgi:hypothetical protein
MQKGAKWADLPPEIQQRMLFHQETQSKTRDASVFERNMYANSNSFGFDWHQAPEREGFWHQVIYLSDFDSFFAIYPKGIEGSGCVMPPKESIIEYSKWLCSQDLMISESVDGCGFRSSVTGGKKYSHEELYDMFCLTLNKSK